MENQSTAPAARECLARIPAYVAGEAPAATHAGRVFKLSSNESAFGPGPQVIDSLAAAARSAERYPDPNAEELRAAIAARYHLDAARICVGNGSEDLLAQLAFAYLRPGDEAVYSQYGFLAYRRLVHACDARPAVAPEIRYHASVDAMLERVTDRTRIVFLANPNNPTGTLLAASEIRRLHAALPPHVLLVLDAAYGEYVAHREDYEAGFRYVHEGAENVAVVATFSKLYGLAALRLGWAYGAPAIVNALNRVRGVFNVGSLTQAAGLAALRDVEHTRRSLAHNAQWLPWLQAQLTALGIEVTPSCGNFVLAHFGAARDGDELANRLKAGGVYVRPLKPYGLPHSLRITVGCEDGNRAVVAALQSILAN